MDIFTHYLHVITLFGTKQQNIQKNIGYSKEQGLQWIETYQEYSNLNIPATKTQK